MPQSRRLARDFGGRPRPERRQGKHSVLPRARRRRGRLAQTRRPQRVSRRRRWKNALHVAVSHETRRRVGDVDASTRGRMEFQLVERVARARERLFVVGAAVQVVEGKLWHGPSRARAGRAR